MDHLTFGEGISIGECFAGCTRRPRVQCAVEERGHDFVPGAIPPGEEGVVSEEAPCQGAVGLGGLSLSCVFCRGRDSFTKLAFVVEECDFSEKQWCIAMAY